MASTELGRRVTEQYRRRQVALSASVIQGMLRLWGLIDPDDVEGTLPDWLSSIMVFLPAQHRAATGLATGYYRAFRLAEFGSSYAGTLPTPGFDDDSVKARLIWGGPAEIRRGVSKGKTVVEAAERARVLSATYAQQIVTDAGRQTVTDAVQVDRRALGWSRFTDGNPCAFCALLASRGPVYKSEASAVFQAHRRCGCGAEPVFSQDQAWPGRAQEWADLYRDAAQGESDQLNAFRRAYEGRGD